MEEAPDAPHPALMQTFTIRRFTGIRNAVESTDAPRGSMRKAEGMLLTPRGAMVGGPAWALTWDLSGLATTINTALGVADATKVHFVTLTRGAAVFLVAWDRAASRARGLFYVGANESNPLDATGSVVVAAPSDSLFRNKAAGLRWYGSRINSELRLGNGTDANLVWRGGTLVALGPASPPADADDPSKYAMPPVKQWVQTADRVIHGAGNVTHPLRVWSTERATAIYPNLEGIYSTDTSFTLVNHTRATAINAIQAAGTSVHVHTDAGVVRLSSFEEGGDGYKMTQSPTKANAGALNPNCVSDSAGTLSYYLGTDLELYRDEAARSGAYENKDRRDVALATASAADLWNQGMADTGHGDTQLLHDRGTGIVFILAPTLADQRGLWAYHEPGDDSAAVSGPIRYPDAVDIVLVTSGRKTLAFALTAGGAFLSADLSAILEQDTWQLPAYTSSIGADYLPLVSSPTPTAGLGYIGITETVGAPGFVQVLEGVTIGMANPWAEWSASGVPTPTLFFKDATILIAEMTNEDFGSPDVIKEYLNVRLQFQRNTRAYVGVFAESEGLRYGRWRGGVYPKEEKLSGLKLVGRRLNLRVIIIAFNASPLLLRDLSVDWEPAVAN